MSAATFQGRRAAAIENDTLRVTLLQEGRHIAEIFDKETGVNPLWISTWRSIELPARGRLETEYWAVMQTADSVPESIVWPA